MIGILIQLAVSWLLLWLVDKKDLTILRTSHHRLHLFGKAETSRQEIMAGKAAQLATKAIMHAARFDNYFIILAYRHAL